MERLNYSDHLSAFLSTLAKENTMSNWFYKTLVTATIFVGAGALLLSQPSCSGLPTSEAKARFSAEGELIRPTDYREWIYVGTPLTPNDMNNGKAPFPEFHNVYINPTAWRHFSLTGEFPQGTMLVKELTSVGSKVATSGAGYFMGEFIGLEVTMKSKERFPNDPGNWAYFSFGHAYPLAETATAFPAATCNSCHANSAADDFVFTQYYPVLRAAKAALTAPMGMNTANHDGQNCGECKSSLKRLDESSEAAKQPTATPEKKVSIDIPVDKAELFKFLTDGKYKEFAAKESKMHPSVGPHSIQGKFGLPVRSYLNAAMSDSLQAGNKSHPAGAGIVKEMFSKAGKLEGWAVSVKTQDDSDNGKGWFWYEVTSTTDSEALVANGNGVPLCFGCHSGGKDFVLTGFPLK